MGRDGLAILKETTERVAWESYAGYCANHPRDGNTPFAMGPSSA
jgi:hypothetical protein